MTADPNKPTVSFVVPALNEEGNIEATVNTIIAATIDRTSDYEIILVNDGSTDNTGKVMDQLALRNPKIHVVHNERNLGFGGAYKRGVAAARCDYVVMICADNVMPPASIAMLLDKIGQADIVIPYISNPGFRSPVRRIGSWGFITILNTLFGLHVSYYNGSVVHRRELLNRITIVTNSFAYQAEALVKLLKAGYSHIEVAIPNVNRQSGRSSALRLKNLWGVAKTITNLIREVRRPGAIPVKPSPEAAAELKRQS